MDDAVLASQGIDAAQITKEFKELKEGLEHEVPNGSTISLRLEPSMPKPTG